ncbi:GHKL domain-containing protein [Clostridium chrysemydis]|uniref:GHKL domain-containing protein n=1 Tax=Clostridium chrysemydis TaxID=2665504 RepID=UPI00188414CE|nr:GHKL domain-containing protein [Clostridium chrysemydis]
MIWVVYDMLWILVGNLFSINVIVLFLLRLFLGIIIFKKTFYMDVTIALFLNLTYQFYNFALYEIVNCLLSKYYNIDAIVLVQNHLFKLLLILLSRVVVSISLYIILSIKVHELESFLKGLSRNQILKITVIQCISSLLILILENFYYFKVNSIVYFVIFLIILIINFIYSTIFFENSIRIENNKQMLTEKNDMKIQIDNQKKYYESIEKELREFKKFKHDYYKFSKIIKVNGNNVLNSNLVSKLESKISKFDNSLTNISNSLVLESLMLKIKNKCKKNNIELDGKIYIPDSLEIEDVDLLRLFLNIFSNAIEANKKLSSNRFIKIKTKYNKGWIIIEFKNPYNHINYEDGKFITTNKDNINHGNGINIIKEICDKYNINYDIKLEKDIFITDLLIKE